MDEEQQEGCFNPVLLGPIVGGGCALLTVFGTLIGLTLLLILVL